MKRYLIATVLTASSLFADVGILTKIVDGDTVHFGNTICRFAYVDTPESRKNNRLDSKVNKCPGVTVETMIKAGKSSKEYVEEILIKGKSYKYNVISTDKYDRKVCEIYNNSEMLNLKIVEDGYAVPYYQYIPKNLLSDFSKASKDAKRLNRGLYTSNPNAIKCIE